MKKASSSFLLVAVAALFVTLQSYAQISAETGRPGRGRERPMPGSLPMQNRVIQEQVNMPLRSYDKLHLGDLLRLSWQEQQNLEVLSLRIQGQSLQVQSMLEVASRGRIISTQPLRRAMQDILIVIPVGTSLADLDLSATQDAYIAGITAEVQAIQRPGPGANPWPSYEQPVTPNSLISLRVNHEVRGHAKIPLDQIVRGQLGLTLEGAKIERVVVEGFSSYGHAASVQVELNQRIVSDTKYLDQSRMVPLPVVSFEEVRSLSLIVNGDAQIHNVRIRVGQVRSRWPETPRTERVLVRREILPRVGMSLSEVLRYDNRLIRSISIEGRATRQYQAMISVLGFYGDLQGSSILNSGPTRSTIVLRRPVAAHELRIDTTERALIDSLEIEFQTSQRY